VALKSGLEVTQCHWTGTIRKLGYGFLFVFLSNYGSILYYFRDKARYWSKIAIFASLCYASVAYAVMRCLSVCLSRSCILSRRVIVSSFYSPSGSQTILVFPYLTSYQYFDGDLLTGASSAMGSVVMSVSIASFNSAYSTLSAIIIIIIYYYAKNAANCKKKDNTSNVVAS